MFPQILQDLCIRIRQKIATPPVQITDHLVERNSGDFLDNSGEESEAVGGVEILTARHWHQLVVLHTKYIRIKAGWALFQRKLELWCLLLQYLVYVEIDTKRTGIRRNGYRDE